MTSKYEAELHEAIELVEKYAGYGVTGPLLEQVHRAAAHLKREVLQTARWVQRVSVLERRLGVIGAVAHGKEPPPDLEPLGLAEVLGTRGMYDPLIEIEFSVEKCPGGDFSVAVADEAGNKVSLGAVLRVDEAQAHWLRERFAEAYVLTTSEEEEP
jgi:hypothetical protein